MKVGLQSESLTQRAVRSTLQAFSKHGSKPHASIAPTVKMPANNKTAW